MKLFHLLNFVFYIIIFHHHHHHHGSIIPVVFGVRPAYESDPGKCKFVNRLTTGAPSEMTGKISGKKYFRRLNESRQLVSFDKTMSICRMYDLEAAEILDQDDYDEVIKIIQETSWSFWIAIKGKFSPDYGNFNFDFTLTDGFTKIGFHDFGPQGYDTSTSQLFEKFQEGCVAVIPNMASPSGVSWAKRPCSELNDVLCQYKKSCYRKEDYVKDPTRPIKRIIPIPNKSGDHGSGFYISTMQATWPFAKQVCEDAGLSLLWFSSDSERSAFQSMIADFENKNSNYMGSMWTAGRFSPLPPNTADIYEMLYWWHHNQAHPVSDWQLSAAKSGQVEYSGGFQKKWGKEREATHLDKNEPYDEGLRGLERCVDASFTDLSGSAEYFTSKCEKSLHYFICKDSEFVDNNNKQLGVGLDDSSSVGGGAAAAASSLSHVEYCIGDSYHRTTEKECNGEIIFAGQAKPDCTCYNGLHGLMSDNRCKPRLLVGSGCTKLKAKASLHWKILPSSSSSSLWIVVMHNSHGGGDNEHVYNWFTVNIKESSERQILGHATTFYFSGFDLYRNPDTAAHEICFVAAATTTTTTAINNNNEYYYEYHVEDVNSLRMRYYNYPEADCGGLDMIPKERLVVRQKANEKNDCQLTTCSKPQQAAAAADKKEKRQTVGKSSSSSSEEEEEEDTTTDNKPPPPPIIHNQAIIKSSSPSSSCIVGDDDDCRPASDDNDNKPPPPSSSDKGKAEGDIEDVNDNVNRQLLIYAIEAAFPHHFTGDDEEAAAAQGSPTTTSSSSSKNTWLILEKLFELAKETCSDMVRQDFFSRVLKYFKIIHFGENYEYGEYFSDPEMKQISTLLDACHQRIKSGKSSMVVQVDGCTGKAHRITLQNTKTTHQLISRFTDDTGYQAVFHHHIMEATWDVVDLWNALCVNEFKSSYLLYHHLEQGLETLFTDKLKKLWHFPNVTEDYFQKLLGPDEGIQLINLDQCVLAAYKANARIHRMGRPNRGRNTVVGQMIRNRLEDEKLKSQGVVPPPPIRSTTSRRRHSNNNNNNLGIIGVNASTVVSTACIPTRSIVRCYNNNNKKKPYSSSKRMIRI